MENLASKSSKDLREEKQRDSKLEEQIIKTLGNASTAEEKFEALLKKFVELDKDKKRLSTALSFHEKRYAMLLRDKENLQKEHNKSVLMRDKLEQVCREQQKLIKSVQNESLKHKETQAKFSVSINEISATLNKNNEENIKLKDDNIDMTKKLKYLAEQYQIREKQLEKINEQIQLESQLHEAKLAKVQMENTIEKEILLRQKQGALDDLLKSQKAIQEMQKREELLKEQLNLYTTKYDDFQSSLKKSNDIFVTYKTELEKMVKKTKKLEKESSEWKRKCEKSTASLLDLSTEKQVKDEHIVKTARQMQQLQKLLRTLQAERTNLYQVLKDNNIETPPMPILPPEPEPVVMPVIKQKPDKMEAMAKNCAELKQSLAMLQGQVSALASKKPHDVQPVEDVVVETTKKNKNKKTKTRNKTCPTKERLQTEIAVEKKASENTVEKMNSSAQTNTDSTVVNVETAASSSDSTIQTATEIVIAEESGLVEQVENVTDIVQDLTINENASNLIQCEKKDADIAQDSKIEPCGRNSLNLIDQSMIADNSWELVHKESICETPQLESTTDAEIVPLTNTESAATS